MLCFKGVFKTGSLPKNTMLVECKCKLPAILPHALRAPVPSKYTPAQSGFFRLSEALGTFPSSGSAEEKKEVEGPKQKSNGENQTVPKSGGASALQAGKEKEREREREKEESDRTNLGAQTRPAAKTSTTTPLRTLFFFAARSEMDTVRPSFQRDVSWAPRCPLTGTSTSSAVQSRARREREGHVA